MPTCHAPLRTTARRRQQWRCWLGGFVADPSLARHIPLGRLGRSEDLAPMALAVLSNRVSAYVTGAAFVVDGGLSLTNWFDPPVFNDISDHHRTGYSKGVSLTLEKTQRNNRLIGRGSRI